MLEAPKYTKIRGTCGAAGLTKVGSEGLDPDVAAQISCMSGEISNIPSLSFEFKYKTRLEYEPFDGQA